MIDAIYNYRQDIRTAVKVSEEWETLCLRFEEELTENYD